MLVLDFVELNDLLEEMRFLFLRYYKSFWLVYYYYYSSEHYY